jgi:hypothetical protein
MAERKIRFDGAAADEHAMATSDRFAGVTFLDGWRQPRVCDGSTPAAATAPSHRSWSSDSPAEAVGSVQDRST